MKNGPVRVGIIGSQFQADCHAAAIGMIEDDMSVVAVASPTAAHAQGLADRYKIPRGLQRLQSSWPKIRRLRRSASLLPTPCTAR